jgi:hypothetical protein
MEVFIRKPEYLSVVDEIITIVPTSTKQGKKVIHQHSPKVSKQ